ncbi:MAG: hypothetical protein ACE5GQ_09270, partial [Nitrospinales bacterium]
AYDAAVKDTKQDVTTSTSTSPQTITVSPPGLSFSADGNQAFTASGGAGSFTFSISGQTNNFTGISITSSTPTSATVTFTQPTSLEGQQSLTIRAVDTNGASGSTTLTLNPATTVAPTNTPTSSP